MGKIILYGIELSPPVRACLLTLNALNLPFDYKNVDLFKGEHKSKEFTKKNPQNTVPTLEDDGHILWDSHAICAYLVRKYGKDDSLYPKDFYARAVVDQRLHFDSGVLFQGGLRNITAPLFFYNETEIPRHKIDAIIEGYNFVEAFLADKSYIAGDSLTIADFSCISTITSLVAFVEIDASKYPKITEWMKRLSQLPYYEKANGNGARLLVKEIKAKITKIL